MYFLLILVHSLFIFISHLFGYYIIEGVFLVLMLFFLLYFSPIFFFKSKEKDFSELFSLELSPQKSLIVPLVLTYIGVYILAFTFSGTIEQSIHIHMIIFLAIYSIFIGYALTFSWKNDVFFDVLKFHLIFSYITLAIVGVYYFFNTTNIGFLDVIFSLVTLSFSLFYFNYERRGKVEFFYFFLISVFLIGEILLFFFFPKLPLYLLVGSIELLSVFLFEYSQGSRFFEIFFAQSRIFFLSVSLVCSILLSILLFFSFESIYFLIILGIFFFSVHMRFSNLIAYVSGIGIIYLLYGFIFFGLIRVNSLFSSLIFIYFFSFLVIINTYFWKEKQKYDFLIIHYFSIFFSIFFFVYSMIFVDWGGYSTLFISFGIFLLAGLLFLSYFRFRQSNI